MFDNNQTNPLVPQNNLPPQNSTTPPPSPQPISQPSTVEPEDIFSKVDPVPVAPPSEPIIKSAPSVFTAPLNPKVESSPQLNIADITAPPKTLDTKSIILLVAIGAIIIGTAAVAFWWFTKNKNNNINNSPAVNLFDNLNNTNNNEPPINNTTDNTNGNLQNNNPANQPINNGLPTTTNNDGDSDGLTDEEEASLGTSPDAVDTDNDSLSDREEVKVYKTDPLKSDTDSDGLSDGDEIKNKKDPLKADAITDDGLYLNSSYKFSFVPLSGMVLVSSNDDLVLFNDDVNQIKVYIYLNNSQPEDLQAPDWLYTIGLNSENSVITKNKENLADKTPVSSEYSTQNYEAPNGFSYTIRYVATKKGPDHQANFESLLSSFKFLK